jgi:GT2 family glycosyltransferase/glycosyltransferase involved in cell wall biosynthesis
MATEPVASLADRDDALRAVFDAEFYRQRYFSTGPFDDAFEHYVQVGVGSDYAPNPWFDPEWYAARYPDVRTAGEPAVLHYLRTGAAQLRDPHPMFDAAFYVDRHPEAARHPLLHYLNYGGRLGWPTRLGIDWPNYLPSTRMALHPVPAGVAVDVVIPVYKGLKETQRCIVSVLSDPARPPGRILVIDDGAPEPALSAWLDAIARGGRITLLRNAQNIGFVASANRGITAAAPHDVVLLNSDTEVPLGWLSRLAGHANAGARIASVSPFSNNATICGYPSLHGGPPALGLPVADLDAACREANAGRSITLPVSMGFCMYVRRAAIDEVGLFDTIAFGRGYGEENDFCMRATARGWTHRLACDTYVHHEGEVSFGADAPGQAESQDVLRARYPGYERLINRHVRVGDADAARWAITASLFRRSRLPTILFVTHALGGGVSTHVTQLCARLDGRANVLLLEGAGQGVVLSAPALDGHPDLTLVGEDAAIEGLAAFLASAGVARVHLHHLLGLTINLRALLRAIDVPFDVTVHDWFMICPQINLLPQLDGEYCGEPDAAGCNACIADRPQHDAHDILSWRGRFTWLFREAERVICPSVDARRRLERYGLAEHAVVVPHDPVTEPAPPIAPAPLRRGEALRVAVLGVLAPQKGLATVLAVARVSAPDALAIHLIGYPESPLPDWAQTRIEQTGRYDNADLSRLIAAARPHAIWFPAQWPETFSYTLSAALETGLPIVATDIGAFPERLAGRPLGWLVAPTAPPERWLAAFASVRQALAKPASAPARAKPSSRAVADFYTDAYLPARLPAPAARAPGMTDLRRPGRLAAVVIPECYEDGSSPTPCAFIRLLQPLDHPACAEGIDTVVASADDALRYRADLFITQRYAIASVEQADALAAHVRTQGVALAYDLDDDLIDIPDDHPEAHRLQPKAVLVRHMLKLASLVTASTSGLQTKLGKLGCRAVLVANGLDERLWSVAGPIRVPRQGPVRFLLMGTATHDSDLALIAPALEALCASFGERVTIDMIGMTATQPPQGVARVIVPPLAGASYPAFVNWIARQEPWHVGLTPLGDIPFNGGKSAIKAMDYAALGMAVLASDVPAYRGSIADGAGGALVGPRADDWLSAMSRMVRSPREWEAYARGAREAWLRTGTLASQAGLRRAVWHKAPGVAIGNTRPVKRFKA